MNTTKDINVIKKLIDKYKIENLNVLGRIKYESDWHIIVDNLEKPNGFIFICNYWNIIFCEDDLLASKMLSDMTLDKNKGFAGILWKYYDIVKEKNEIDWEESCYLYYLNKEDFDNSPIKHVVKSLRLKDAETVYNYYTYKDEDPIDYIKECIINRPSAAVFDENENPISWAVTREDGSMGIMYTKKEHRGKGLAKSVSKHLAKLHLDNNDIPYVHILFGNENSVNLAESIGFKKFDKVKWFGVK